MSKKTTLSITAALILISLALGLALYPRLPERMPSHWNAQGQVDGYSGRGFAVFFLPLVTAGLALLLMFIPALDPLKANAEQFRPQYNLFILVFTLFMLFLYLASLAAGLGVQLNMTLALLPAFAVLDFFIAYMLSKAQRNWFIGIRTPWTLSSDAVWQKTHNLGARLFALAGLASLVGLLAPQQAFLFLIVPLLLAALVSSAWSYVFFRAEKSG
jgi:uncharacterized membrane protein